MRETGAQRAPRCLHPDLRVGSPCAAAARAAARSFRKKFGPGADRKIWEMAALILEEAILFGRNDGIDDPVAAAERLERAKVLTAPETIGGSLAHADLLPVRTG